MMRLEKHLNIGAGFMTALENAVQTLASALDSLEGKLDDRMQDLGAKTDSIEAARKQAATARAFVNTASEDVAATVKELHALLDGPTSKSED